MNYTKLQLNEETIQYSLTDDHRKISFKEWLENMRSSSEFRQTFNALLKEIPFPAFFWETPPLQNNNTERDFEFVVLNASALYEVKATPQVFAEYYSKDKTVVSFSNLSGGSKLIVPCNIGIDYPHLASFVRTAPAEQTDEFWKLVADEYLNALGEEPKWLSTSGLGVYWLHVRIDSRPKYYRFLPYKNSMA